jgi:peptidyl-prolyl cis-trans isomerase SurA
MALSCGVLEVRVSIINRCFKSSTLKTCLLLAFFVHVQQSCAELVLMDGVAAHANEHVITLSDVLEGMDPVRRQLMVRFDGSELQTRLRRAYDETLRAIVERYLVLDLYEEGEGRLPEWLIDQRAEDFIRNTFDGKRSELMEALAEEQLTYDKWRRQVEEQLIVASMRSTSVVQHVNVSPEDIREYYDSHPDEFTSSGKINFRMIQVLKDRQRSRQENRREADSTLNRLYGGEDFSVLARQVSDGVNAKTGGDWGWVEPKVLRNELLAALDVLQAGETTELIETEGEYYILKLEGRRESALMTFQEAQPLIESTLKRKHGEKLYSQWMERLRRDAYVKVFKLEWLRN